MNTVMARITCEKSLDIVPRGRGRTRLFRFCDRLYHNKGIEDMYRIWRYASYRYLLLEYCMALSSS